MLKKGLVNSTTPLRVIRFVSESSVRYRIQSKPVFGKWIKDELVSMGPAFIKFGQFLSTRPDILGKEVATELSNLQDNIESISFNEIKKEIETSLQQPLMDVFETFEENSIASASIGQVHKAVLKSNGKLVAVKIQKPQVAVMIKEDLTTLRKLTDILIALQFQQAKEFERILSQYEKFLSGELYYQQELEYMQKFKALLNELPVVVPGVYKKLSTNNVLIMQYVPSIKINNIKLLRSQKISTPVISQELVKLFIYQILKAGYVHSDPHPGNIGIIKDNTNDLGFRFVMYDFGNVIQFTPEFQKSIGELIFSIYQKDINEFINLLVKLKLVEQLDNPEDTYEMVEFFTYFFKYLESLDIYTLKKSINDGDLTTTLKDNINLNPDFLALFRVFSLLDGTCSLLDPNFNYFEALEPYTQDMMQDLSFLDTRARRDLEKISQYPNTIQSTDGNLVRLKRKITTLNQKMFETKVILYIMIILSLLEFHMQMLL